MGGLGAIVATAPVQAVLLYTDWRGVFVGLSAATVVVAAAIFTIVPTAPVRSRNESWSGAVLGAIRVFVDPLFLRVAPIAVLNQASFLAYHGLWASDWMREVQALERSQVGPMLALATVGIVLGTFGSGLIADRLSRRGIPTIFVAAAMSTLYMLVQFSLVLRLPIPAPLVWGAFAFFGMSTALYYAVLGQSFPADLSGRVNTALNMLVFVGAFLLQWLIGVVLGFWPSDEVANAHRVVMGSILLLQAGALAWLHTGGRLAQRMTHRDPEPEI
jgi:predicted MFS family arabinose efflux permease